MDYSVSYHTVFMPAGEYIREYRDEDNVFPCSLFLFEGSVRRILLVFLISF